jgi:hypothetical protein
LMAKICGNLTRAETKKSMQELSVVMASLFMSHHVSCFISAFKFLFHSNPAKSFFAKKKGAL